MSDEERRQAKPLKAIGLAASMEDGDPVGLLRIVIR
jgi:hypothetical protein